MTCTSRLFLRQFVPRACRLPPPLRRESKPFSILGPYLLLLLFLFFCLSVSLNLIIIIILISLILLTCVSGCFIPYYLFCYCFFLFNLPLLFLGFFIIIICLLLLQPFFSSSSLFVSLVSSSCPYSAIPVYGVIVCGVLRNHPYLSLSLFFSSTHSPSSYYLSFFFIPSLFWYFCSCCCCFWCSS